MYVRSLAVAAIMLLLPSVLSQAVAETTVPILLYHRFNPEKPAAMTVTTPVFAAQLAWLAEHKIAVVRLGTVVDAVRGKAPLPGNAVVLTADDGHRSVYTDMYPLIRRYHVPVTLFIYPSAISNASYALTWEQIAEMLRSGLVEVQSHTYWHPNFHIEKRRLSPHDYTEFATMQLARSKATLEQRLGISVDLLAWPFGIHDAELDALASRCGYRAAFTIERARVRASDDLFALPRFIVTDQDRGARFAALVNGAAKAP